jgi:hypothetical protein
LEPDRRRPDLALELGARGEGGDRVDDDEVERVGADELVDDLQRGLAAVGLRDEQRFQVDADRARVRGVERVLRVDEGGPAAGGLDRGDRVQGDGGFARRLGAENFDDAPFGQAAAQGDVQGEGAGGDGFPGGERRGGGVGGGVGAKTRPRFLSPLASYIFSGAELRNMIDPLPKRALMSLTTASTALAYRSGKKRWDRAGTVCRHAVQRAERPIGPHPPPTPHTLTPFRPS